MIPTRRFFLLQVLGLIPLLVVRWGGGSVRNAVLAMIGWDLLLLVVALLDWRMSEDSGEWQVSRILPDGPERLMIGVENRIRISFTLPPGPPLQITIRDEYPAGFELLGERQVTVATEQGEDGERIAAIDYRLLADRRGDHLFGDILTRWPTPWGLLLRQARHDASGRCKVYPDLNQARRHELASRSSRMLQLGHRRSRFRGQGREFESLRDYVPGDELRHVSWTATARRGRMTTRQYQIERNQSIVIMLDAGRLMTSRIDGLTKLDHAIDAALSIGHVAAAGGDNIGLLVFNRQVAKYLPPQKGHAQLLAMIEALYDLEAQMIEPSYARAFEYLSRNCRKRSLVVILTDLVDREASADLLAYTAALHPHHLPLIVTIGDKDLRSMIDRLPESSDDVYRQSVAEELLQEREEALARIIQFGGLALDLPAGNLSLGLVRKYLEVKERGLL